MLSTKNSTSSPFFAAFGTLELNEGLNGTPFASACNVKINPKLLYTGKYAGYLKSTVFYKRSISISRGLCRMTNTYFGEKTKSCWYN